MNSKKESVPWLDNFSLSLDRCIGCGEGLIVMSLMVAIGLTIFLETIWILWAPHGCTQARFSEALKTLNDNWKVGLIILIPLFFRAIRAFLERVEEFGGMKAPHKVKTSDPKKEETEEIEEKKQKE